MSWLIASILAGVSALVLYIIVKYQNKLLDLFIEVSPYLAKFAEMAFGWSNSNIQRLLRYANIAAAAVEQSYKKLKAEKKKMYEDGKITKEELDQFYRHLKEEAIRIVKQLAKADGMEINNELESVLESIIESIVFFLPKKSDIRT